MLVSSTEPPAFHQLGDLSTLPERYGVDFVWRGVRGEERGWCGVQRKEVKDLIASIRDSRLARESKQMRSLLHALLIVEGEASVVGGSVVAGRASISVAQWDSAIWTLQHNGVMHVSTNNKSDTRNMILRFQTWTQKHRHATLDGTREPVRRSEWGTASSRDFGVHLLTGLPGVGTQTAERIYDHFGGVPWKWDVTEEELCQVPGVGKNKAQRMIEALTKENSYGTPST